jgi:hypothetical protein
VEATTYSSADLAALVTVAVTTTKKYGFRTAADAD